MIGYSKAFAELYGPKPIEGNNMNQQIRQLAEQASKQIGMVGFHNIPKEFIAQFGYLLLEEIMQTLIITGHEDAVDTLNKHFGVKE